MHDSSFIQANTNGVLHEAGQATLSPLNRGFLYGDAIYEVWRTYEGALFAWDEHWQRLGASAHSIHLDVPWSRGFILAEVAKTASAFRTQTSYSHDLYIRLQIFRGEGAIGLDIHLADRPGYVILVKAVPPLSDAVRRDGNRLIIARTIRRNSPHCLDPAWKTGNYLNNIMGLREAKTRGADDVVFLNLAGHLTESSTSNVAFIKGNQLVTPPLADGILPGITRARVLQTVAASTGLSTAERSIREDELREFDEAMLLSTTKDIQPVGCIEGVDFRVDKKAKLWRLKEAFTQYAVASARERSEFQV